jgi:hypothetical protein
MPHLKIGFCYKSGNKKGPIAVAQNIFPRGHCIILIDYKFNLKKKTW